MLRLALLPLGALLLVACGGREETPFTDHDHHSEECPEDYVNAGEPYYWDVGRSPEEYEQLRQRALRETCGSRIPTPVAINGHTPTPTPTSHCGWPARGETPIAWNRSSHPPGRYSFGSRVVVIPRGTELEAVFEGVTEVWESQGETSSTTSETTTLLYRLRPGGNYVEVKTEIKVTKYPDDREPERSEVSRATLRASDGSLLHGVPANCQCPGAYLTADMRALVTIYCGITSPLESPTATPAPATPTVDDICAPPPDDWPVWDLRIRELIDIGTLLGGGSYNLGGYRLVVPSINSIQVRVGGYPQCAVDQEPCPYYTTGVYLSDDAGAKTWLVMEWYRDHPATWWLSDFSEPDCSCPGDAPPHEAVLATIACYLEDQAERAVP